MKKIIVVIGILLLIVISVSVFVASITFDKFSLIDIAPQELEVVHVAGNVYSVDLFGKFSPVDEALVKFNSDFPDLDVVGLYTIGQDISATKLYIMTKEK